MADPCKQEKRIAQLEANDATQSTSIIYLGDQIKGLVSEMRWQNRLVITLMVGALIYFIKMVIGGALI